MNWRNFIIGAVAMAPSVSLAATKKKKISYRGAEVVEFENAGKAWYGHRQY